MQLSPVTPGPIDWNAPLARQLAVAGVPLRDQGVLAGGIRLLEVDPAHWHLLGQQMAQAGCRFAGLWGQQRAPAFELNAAFAHGGELLLARTRLPGAPSVEGTPDPREGAVGASDGAEPAAMTPSVASLGDLFPAANRLERHCRDLLGIHFSGSLDPRRWTRHQGWDEGQFPLRDGDPRGAVGPAGITPADSDYPCQAVAGSAVYEIPVGPVHAGIIEPGHFRFQAVGETVLHLEARLGYVHKGIEKLAQGRDAAGLLRLAARVSGDSALAHAWAACQAMERAAGVTVPPRGQYLRGLWCEREWVANHLGDIGAICNDVGFVFAQMQFSRLREAWLRRNHQLGGHRLLMDVLCPGGVVRDLAAADRHQWLQELDALRQELQRLWPLLHGNQSLRDRLYDTGVMTPAQAAQLGCLGYVGRASGQAADLRRDAPYAPYDQVLVEPQWRPQGDVAARVLQRAAELDASLDIQRQLLERLPDGPLTARWQAPVGGEGIGRLEGWRGEILCYVRFDAQGRVARFFPRDPSWFNWPALELLIHDNIVADFPVCNKSVNGSYAGQDL